MSVFLWWLPLVARIGHQLAGAGDEEEFFPDDPLLAIERCPRAETNR